MHPNSVSADNFIYLPFYCVEEILSTELHPMYFVDGNSFCVLPRDRAVLFTARLELPISSAKFIVESERGETLATSTNMELFPVQHPARWRRSVRSPDQILDNWGAIQMGKNHHENHHENHQEKTSHQKVTIKNSNWTFVMIFMMIFVMFFFPIKLGPWLCFHFALLTLSQDVV